MTYVRSRKPAGAPRWQEPWETAEEDELLALKALRFRNRDIARALGRTPKAIKHRLEVVR